METLDNILAQISPVDENARREAADRQDRLTKPRGSLGRLEEIACRVCAIKKTNHPRVSRKRIVLFAADHGVTEEGVTLYPKEVTSQMVRNFVRKGAAINAIGESVGVEVEVVDIGVDDDLADMEGFIRKKIARGTSNIARGPAMSIEQATEAVLVGVERAETAWRDGIELLGTGDMGIGNTTPSAALYAAMLDLPASEVTGRGTGLGDERLIHKVKIVEQAIKVNKTRITDTFSALAALGGFEIAGLCGLVIGAARRCIPVVIDGFISSAAAMMAIKMKPEVRQYCFFGHLSQEKGHAALMERFGEKPLLDLDMRLGEGTGAALAMAIIEAAVAMHNNMATFDSAGVSDKEG